MNFVKLETNRVRPIVWWVLNLLDLVNKRDTTFHYSYLNTIKNVQGMLEENKKLFDETKIKLVYLIGVINLIF